MDLFLIRGDYFKLKETLVGFIIASVVFWISCFFVVNDSPMLYIFEHHLYQVPVAYLPSSHDNKCLREGVYANNHFFNIVLSRVVIQSFSPKFLSSYSAYFLI